MTSDHERRLYDAAERLASLLSQRERKIVFAESCTAGLITATLARTPGISDYLCGSAVVYRNATKSEWLNVSAEDLANPAITAVSAAVAEAMATAVLQKTPEADLSASITGHLGPGSPSGKDGLAYVSVAVRDAGGLPRTVFMGEVWLIEEPNRVSRQIDAAARVIEIVGDVLSDAAHDVK